LELTTEEAQAFWPLHSEFEKEVRSVDAQLPELEKEQGFWISKKDMSRVSIKYCANPKRVERILQITR
jgi:hypothetical protein